MSEIWKRKTLFYRDCFEADSRDLSISNVLNVPEKHRYFFSGKEELLTQVYPRMPLPPEEGKVLFLEEKQYQREKLLVYGTAFIVGAMEEAQGFSKAQKFCAPLIYSAATMEQDGENFFVSLKGEFTLNAPLLKSILKPDAKIEALEMQLALPASHFDSIIARLHAWLRLNTEARYIGSLYNFPHLAEPEEFEKATRARKHLYALSSAAVTLVNRPRSARGVLYALETIAQQSETSAPFKAALTGEEVKHGLKHQSRPDVLPVILSDAQKKSLQIAASETLGIISGPPGTGKSFTIAAIIVDRVLNGEKVLVVSETEQAVEVIANKLEDNFSIQEGVVRAGREKYLVELKSYLEDLIKMGVEDVSNEEVNSLRDELDQLIEDIELLESQYHERADKSIDWGRKLAGSQLKKRRSLMSRLLQSWLGYRIKGQSRHWEMLESLYELETRKSELAQQYIAKSKAFRLQLVLQAHRKQFVNLNQAIRARTSLRQENLFKSLDYASLLGAFPIWLVSLSTLHKVLPLNKELFDVVIFDEASQCNIAASLPAMYRAKRALVVGDTKQLKHVSFLAEKKELQLLNARQLNPEDYISFRKNSILDLISTSIANQKAVTMLDEHFRSEPDIIAFSNKTFYRDRLKVMQHRPADDGASPLTFKIIDGSRDEDGVNVEEAKCLLDDVKAAIASSENSVMPKTIGILSPYRAQVEYLNKKLYEELDAYQIDLHEITVGTPYHFQGEERDHMFLSFAICENSLRAANYLNTADMFNVAITRAKQAQTVYMSLSLEKLKPDNLLRQYASFAQMRQKHNPPKIKDEFQDEICLALKKKGLKVWKSYPVANRIMDVLVGYQDKYLAVDLIGFPGAYERYYTLNTYKIFRRAGLEVVPISYGVWQQYQAECVEVICRALDLKES